MEIITTLASTYKHLKFYLSLTTADIVIWGIYAGFVIGAAISYYNKAILGETVRALLKKEILSKENAATLDELGIKYKKLVARSLKNGRSLRKYIDIANYEKVISEKPISPFKKKMRKLFLAEEAKLEYDFDKMKIFIPEDKKYAADARYEQKKVKLIPTIVLLLLLTAVAVLVRILFIPDLLQLLDNFLSRHF